MRSTPLPQLPDWLNQLLEQDWTPETSLMVDRWLAYLAAEFEGVEA